VAQKSLYEFGPYRIDVALNRLQHAGEAIPLPPKAFDLLLLLARNADRVVAKSELMESLWPNTFVEDANLTQHVYTLRKVLGDQPDGQPYIQTVSRRGYRLAAVVRECGAERAGSALAPTVAEPTPSPAEVRIPTALEDERKQATVLHCTVSDAAAIVDRLGSGGLRDVLSRLLDIGASAVGRYEGVISQHQRDGFVAVFGGSMVHEDDGRRAILAALAIQQRSSGIFAPPSADDESLGLRIGINTGPLLISRVAGNHGIEYTAVGETMRTADLLQQFARPGDVLVSETTRDVAEKYISLEPVAIPPTKHVVAFRVVAVRRKPAIAPRITRALAPFVGRGEDVALLERVLTAALAGRGQVVNIVGEPGMGKSRLVDEFTRSLDAESAAVLEGRCVSYGSPIPYLPLCTVLRAQCAVDESDAPDEIRRAIEQTVCESGLPLDAGGWLVRLLGVTDAADPLETLSPEAVKARTFDALRRLLLKVATRRPLILVIEDAHWIDRTSEEFLALLAERLMAVPMMLLVTCRPGYAAPWMHCSSVTQITLAPLAPADSRRLIESVAQAGPLTAEVSRAILDRGEGNPFFLEELARSFVEHGPATRSIPQTVHGVIMARVDRLPNPTKQLLQTASVVGREVSLGLLKRVWDGAPDIEGDLDRLCRDEFLYERPTGDDPAYVFKHALTQDVAYDSLLARSRRDLHLRAARALEQLHADRLDDIAATLAYHYVRTDLVVEAVDWLTRAADQGARVYANAEAILHLDFAARRLQRLPEGPDRDRRMVQVALRHAHSLYFLGRFRESVEVLRPHEARLARLNDPALSAAYAFWLAHMYSRLGDQRSAADSAQRAIEAASRVDDGATLGKAHGLLALEGHWSGNTRDGIAHGEEAIRLLRTQPDQRWWLGMAHFYLAMNHLLIGRFEAALQEAARADDVGREIGDPRLQTYAGFTVGWVEALRGRSDAAIAACRRSLAQAPDRVSRAYASMILGYALLESGAHLEARALLEPLVGEIGGFGFPQWQALSAAFTGESYRREGRLEEASSFVAHGLDIATRARYWYAVGVAHRIAGRIARDRGGAAEAVTAWAHAVSTFERIGAEYEAARTRQELAPE
jgi:DNA-binding winged helix-turn-helix (wHTH) protein/tetratricopeptide (TPR) repeat protein